jgi:glutaminyl-peptide cyclotransferase
MLSRPLVLLSILLGLACSRRPEEPAEKSLDSLSLAFTIIKTLPHDQNAFTEGLIIENGTILESTGLHGQSWIAVVNPETGVHDKKITLDRQYFGEGITVLNNKIYQLTYQTKIGFIYNADDFQKIGEFRYTTEGWGLTHDSKNLIMSDGTEKLYFLDTINFKVVKTITIVEGPGNGRVKNLNELEYIDGYIFANLYETSFILKIDPRSGKVVGRIDLSTIDNEIQRSFPKAEELNGIAYDAKLKALLVTGKFWPKTYLVRLH